MAYLTVAGITILCEANTSVEGPPLPIGSETRAFAGNTRVTVRAEKRTWTFETQRIPVSDVATLRAAIASSVQVSCAGDALGGTFTCIGKIVSVKDSLAGTTDGTGILKKVVFTLTVV